MSETSREKHCAHEIRRLKTLDFFPSDEVAIGELVKTLWRVAESNAHATRIIDRALTKGFGDSGRSCPTPAELTELGESVSPSDAQPKQARRDCQLCFGTGWHLRAWVQSDGPFAGVQYSGVALCSCRAAA